VNTHGHAHLPVGRNRNRSAQRCVSSHLFPVCAAPPSPSFHLLLTVRSSQRCVSSPLLVLRSLASFHRMGGAALHLMLTLLLVPTALFSCPLFYPQPIAAVMQSKFVQSKTCFLALRGVSNQTCVLATTPAMTKQPQPTTSTHQPLSPTDDLKTPTAVPNGLSQHTNRCPQRTISTHKPLSPTDDLNTPSTAPNQTSSQQVPPNPLANQQVQPTNSSPSPHQPINKPTDQQTNHNALLIKKLMLRVLSAQTNQPTNKSTNQQTNHSSVLTANLMLSALNVPN